MEYKSFDSVKAPMIGILGAGNCNASIYDLAVSVGAQLAQQNCLIICGGLEGVMAAACEGAKQNGGTTIGVLPGLDANSANPWVDIAIPTGLGDARNLIIVRSAMALIAISGEYGTLSEIAFSLKLGKPLIGLQTWQPVRPGATDPDFPLAQTAAEAVRWVMNHVSLN